MIPGKTSASGFTFVETLVAILATSLLLAAVAPIAARGYRHLERLAVERRELATLATAYDLFREACMETRPPRWFPASALVEDDAETVIVKFPKGERNATWKLTLRDGEISVEFDGRTATASAKRARIIYIGQDARVIGLGLDFSALGRDWRWRAYFGASGV